MKMSPIPIEFIIYNKLEIDEIEKEIKSLQGKIKNHRDHRSSLEIQKNKIQEFIDCSHSSEERDSTALMYVARRYSELKSTKI